MLISARSVQLCYGPTVALADASVELSPHEVVALTGRSGSGKSSLLYCLAGILRPDRGILQFRGEDMRTMNDAQLTLLRRRHFGFVFQFGELVPELTLEENVQLPMQLLGWRRKEVTTRTGEMLERLGIAELSGRRPAQVSGGQAQRAAVARALVHRPAVVFADEPTGALDERHGQIVLSALVELARCEDTAVLLVTHDRQVAAAADRVLEVRDGAVGTAARSTDSSAAGLQV